MVDSQFYKQPTLPDLISTQKIAVMPKSIGPYHVDSLLSKGGMSLLYLGSHPQHQYPIAIKVLSPDFVDHPEAVGRFLQEAQIIMMANHPNVVKLYGQGEWEKGLYIAMEFIKGVSLRHYILHESLSMRRALEIILQVAHALLHLHSHGIIHRDLKPENILMTEDGDIKVIDFGIAQLHQEQYLPHSTTPPSILGTPNYMSPEQKENPSRACFASDLYALGIILYELITGKLSHGMVNLSVLPKGLKEIFSKTLAISISERYQDTSHFIHDISQYLHSQKMNKEKPESDQIKEIHECLQHASHTFSPTSPPLWDLINLGVAKLRTSSLLGLYYDFFKFPNNTFLIFMASPALHSVASIAYTGYLRGVIQTLLADHPSQTFNLTLFTNRLNTLLCQDPIQQQFALDLLFLDPLEDQLTYLSCGFGPLIHLPQALSQARTLFTDNALLGVNPSLQFSETKDNWNSGDLLLLHTLPIQLPSATLALTSALEEHALLSSQRQAEAILKNISLSLPLSSFPKALITIERL